MALELKVCWGLWVDFLLLFVLYINSAILICAAVGRLAGLHCVQHKIGIAAAQLWCKGKLFPLAWVTRVSPMGLLRYQPPLEVAQIWAKQFGEWDLDGRSAALCLLLPTLSRQHPLPARLVSTTYQCAGPVLAWGGWHNSLHQPPLLINTQFTVVFI